MINNKENTNPVKELTYLRFPLQMLSEPWASNADVIVYAYMLNRFNFFKGLQKNYYENIKEIAQGSKQDESTVKRAIKKLEQYSYLTISKVKVGLGVSNSYDIADIHSVLDVKPNTVQKVKPKIRTNTIEEDDSNLPW